MSEAITRLTLVCLMLAVPAGAVSPSIVIRGTLLEKGSPIENAAVFLQSFDDISCAKLFASKKSDRKSEQRLDVCAHDVATVSVNDRGYYQFAGQKPGWYAVHFLWNISNKPRRMSVFKEGHWAVLYAGRKDSTGKYDTMAQDVPFYYSNEEDSVRDFDTQH